MIENDEEKANVFSVIIIVEILIIVWVSLGVENSVRNEGNSVQLIVN